MYCACGEGEEEVEEGSSTLNVPMRKEPRSHDITAVNDIITLGPRLTREMSVKGLERREIMLNKG